MKNTLMMLDYPSPHFNNKVQCISQAQEHEQKGEALEAHGPIRPKTITATGNFTANIFHWS
uniref:Uncharacterized protein n=1 Tax=Zea mays TaxID=4577 RepID=B8A0V2_MAIZE|nr:unknown [Zea mays]